MKTKRGQGYYIVLILFFLLVLLPQAKAIANPAAFYCKELGYDYQIRIDEQGNQYGVCIFPGKSECEGWQFYEGKCGKEFAKPIDISTALEATALKSSEKPTEKEKLLGSLPKLGSEYNASDYNEWDWRDPPAGTRFQGNDWLTSVKNQGSCGSCWAFAALGVVETRYNIYNNDSELDLNLSEQELVSCDSISGDCNGGYLEKALDYVRDNGTIDEACFSYLGCKNWSANYCYEEWPCNRCSDSQDRDYKITNYYWVDNTTDAMKQALIDYGPLSVALNSSELFQSSGESLGSADHAVVLVGWNDTENNWTIKNSWGTGWGNSGYGKIAYGNIEKYDWVLAVIATEIKPSVTLNSPADDYNAPSNSITFNCSAQDIDSLNGLKNMTLWGNFTGNWTSNQTQNMTGTSNSTTFTLNLSAAAYIWSCQASCQSKLSTSGNNRTLNVNLAPGVTLNNPIDDLNSSSLQQTFNCSATDNTGLKNLSLYIWNSTSIFYNNSTNITGTSNSSEWQVDMTANKQYNWSCLVYDDANLSTWASNRNLAIDTLEPTIEAISPTTTLVRSTVWINASYSDALTGIQQATHNITNSSGSQATGNLNTNYNTSQLADGNYTINYTAIDYANNSNSTTKNITIDNTNPSVTLELSDTSIDEGNTVDINCTASDDNGIENITITYNSATIKICTSSPCDEEDYKPSWTGTKTITCRAYDETGNSDTDTEDLDVDEDDGGGGGGSSGNGGDDNIYSNVEDEEETEETEEAEATYDINTELEKNKKKTKKLAKGESVGFKVKNEDHIVEVDKIYSDKVRLKISSDTFYIIIEINETRNVDIDNNDLDDLTITLLSIEDDKANLQFELLEEATETSTGTNESLCGNSVCDVEAGENCLCGDCPCAENETCVEGNCVAALRLRISKQAIIYIIVGIVIIAIIIAITMFRKKFIIIKYHKNMIIKRRHH